MTDNNLIDDMSTLDNTDISLDTNFTFDTLETLKTNKSSNNIMIKQKIDNKETKKMYENKLLKISEEEEKKLNNKPFYKLSILEITIELKNTIFAIMDDLLGGNFSINILFKDNRMFYVGLTILIISIILYIYDYAIDGNNNSLQKLIGGGNGIVEIRHIYDPTK